jgi:hypothetical protein
MENEKIRRCCAICLKHTKNDVTLHEVKYYEAFGGPPKLDALDMAAKLNQQQKMRLVENGDFVCSEHFAPKTVKKYSFFQRPQILEAWSPFWNAPSVRDAPSDRVTTVPYEPPKRNFDFSTPSGKERLRKYQAQTEASNLKERVEEMDVELKDSLVEAESARNEIAELKEYIKKLESRIDQLQAPPSILRVAISKCKNKAQLIKETKNWIGVADFEDFFAIIKPYLKSCLLNRPAWEQRNFAECMMAWIRQGFRLKCVSYLLQPDRDVSTMKRGLKNFLRELFPWALTMIRYPTLQEWKSSHSDEILKTFPCRLFYFVDGTILEVWTPSDIAKNRNRFNTKHSCPSISFFVVANPIGRIVYLSPIGPGNYHDATAWNEAFEFPGHVMVDDGSLEVKEEKKLVTQLEEVYPKPWTIDERDYTLCVGGDKAYPEIILPADWHVYVTMTAEHQAIESEPSDQSSAYLINNDRRRHKSPELAKYRAVVERVIGAMKKFKILLNVEYVSQIKDDILHKLLYLIAAIVNYNLDCGGTSY